MSRPRLIALVLVLVTLAVYLPAIRDDFSVCDDDDYVTHNDIVQQGLTRDGVKWAFTTFRSCNWHPLTWLSLMADAQIYGLNPAGFHFTNILFHAANTGLLFLLFWRLTGLIPPAMFVAVMFAWHPAHVESVAWVAERKDVLSTFFGFLALLNYAIYAKENRRRNYWLGLLLFALSLLAKPMLVTLPFLLLLLDFWPLDRMVAEFRVRNIGALVIEKIPFFILTAASCAVTWIAQTKAEVPLEWLPLHYRFENLPYAVMRYVLELLWPTDLAFFYPYGPIPSAPLALSIVATPLITVAVWLARRHNRCWLMGWLWFLGTLVPVIGLVQVGAASMADRYTYIPSIGIFAAVAFGLYALPGWRRVYPFVAALPAIACVMLTEKQLGYWRDDETHLSHTIAVTDANHFAHYLLATAYNRSGQDAKALSEYYTVMRINPADTVCYVFIGDILSRMGRPAEALAAYRRAISDDPRNPILHNNAGAALAAMGDIGAATQEFGEAERLSPQYTQPYLELAKYYLAHSMESQAREELWTAVRKDPYYFHTLITAAHYLAANANAAGRDAQSAMVLALQAKGLALSREQSECHDVLGMAFAAIGDFSDATMCARKALEFAPDAEVKDTAPLRARLELYQKQQPWMESFAATNAPPVK